MAGGYVSTKAQIKKMEDWIGFLEKDWGSYKLFIYKELIETETGEIPIDIPINEIENFLRMERAEAIPLVGTPEDMSLNKARELFENKDSPFGMVTVSGSISSFLENIQRTIKDWNLDVDKDVTIPQALVAAKKKRIELIRDE